MKFFKLFLITSLLIGFITSCAEEETPQDDYNAVEWLKKAAEQGLASAQFELGVMYHEGDRVPQDQDKAIEWLEKAAAQNFANAYEVLGYAGTLKRYDKASSWVGTQKDEASSWIGTQKDEASSWIGDTYCSWIGIGCDDEEESN